MAVRIPESPRVIYASNPLADVICQVRFPRILRIDNELPADFQDAIRGQFPHFAE
ncbi:MAG: TIGR04255 family protein, partial [Deltaproteobacteria bacterium]|nr:TIGR04255 family protein [Deltaproteobacteria bacterium]